jgi:two-component system chemotaxis sensor kinase CheA
VFAGATIMGDGTVALILDVLGLAQRAGVVSGARERARAERPSALTGPAGDVQTVLLCRGTDGGQLAIPLALVARLEEVPRSAVERVGGRDVIQYRGDILSLIDLSRALRRSGGGRVRIGGDRDTVPVVVYAAPGRQFGLVVDHILDVTEVTVAARGGESRPGVLFTAVVQGRVTEFLDVERVVRAALPDDAALGARP